MWPMAALYIGHPSARCLLFKRHSKPMRVEDNIMPLLQTRKLRLIEAKE